MGKGDSMLTKLTQNPGPRAEADVCKESGSNLLRETPRDAGSNWGTSRGVDIGISYFGEPLLAL